ncbi:cullin-9 isoform X2 [Girardinichthys multiradiatus]|uniref:cullin-9 isoform X2 n=1 Tax=Girardinichthys multiradiatus TaxID=208333 RepID=UPI001FAC4BB3|nr:cullin-9 isoform X2 [Girardinichthys multiradiatus]
MTALLRTEVALRADSLQEVQRRGGRRAPWCGSAHQTDRTCRRTHRTYGTSLDKSALGRKRKVRAQLQARDSAATMVGERRNGNLLVQLGPRLQAYPEELIRQRRTHDGQTEYLIRWCLVTIDDRSSSGGGASETSGASDGGSGVGGSGGSTSGETKPENILMWMTMEDVYANCPTLLGKRKADTQRPLQPQEKQLGGASVGTAPQSSSEFPPDVTFDEVELSDMKQDVKNLVCRARKQMAKKSDFSINIMHTIHVLSAYASIGSLVGVFKETGALNLLMELLCNKETQTRRSAGKMLRALASHDAGSRAYVLLSLSQQDGIEQHMDFDNRFTLLELFAETTSSEEHGISFEGIHLPQIPGKLLFSLVKRYLCVTSLMDKLNTAGAESCSDRQDGSPAPASSSGSTHQTELLRIQKEFDFTMAMANLISELVRVMGWDRNRKMPEGSTQHLGGGGACGEEQGEEAPRLILRSIFQPRFCTSSVPLSSSSPVAAPAATPTKKKTGNGFRAPFDFTSRSAYVEYVQDTLKSGMMVRMLEDYEEVSAGDEGEFRYSNDGSPPVQVYWNSLSRTYWVHWHMVEILGSGSSSQSEKETQEKASTLAETLKFTAVSQTFFSKPPGGLYSLPYLTDGLQAEPAVLSRAEWWEILFFIKKLELQQQQEVNSILHQSLDDQEVEPDDSSLINLSVSGDVAKKLLHYLKQKLPSSCLSDLLCSHAFSKHYLKRGGGSLEDEELLAESSLGPPGLGGGGGTQTFTSSSSASSSSSSAKGSISKKAKKELPLDSGFSETETELPTEDDSKYPDDLEDKMKVFNNPKVQGKKTLLEKLGEVVDILKKGGSASDPAQQLAAVLFIVRLLEEKSVQDKNSMRSDSAQTVRDKVLKLLVELLGYSSKDVVVSTLRLTHLLMLKYEWRVCFATEGGVKAVLSCMQEFSAVVHVVQLALATLKVITGASKHDLRSVGSSLPLSESGTQMMLEIFASIGSATPEGSRGLLSAIPVAIDLMLKTQGCMLSVRNGLLVVIMLIANHKSLAEQLVACGITAVLKKCLTLSRAETMLAIIALNHISMVHKLESKDCQEQLDLKDTELQMLVVSLKELTVTKEVIQTLEQLLCDDASQLEEERRQVTHSRDTYQDLVRLMEQHRADRAVQLSILRILNKFLDNYQEDMLPWHESIEPCLSTMTALINDREVVQLFIRFLYRLASLNKDYAVVMCRLGTKEALVKALDKHSTNLLLVTELRDLISDCEKYASLYKKMTTSVLAGCIQMVLGQIEEHRRSHQPINIPFFDVFLRNLCQGSSVELKEDKCWEKVEVSSNHHRASKLTDKNPKTYWESNGCTGSHFINIYMHKGVVIRQLAILVASEDSSYMPARILVLGGDDPANINTELNTVNVAASATRVVLLENMTRFWSIIQIRIKRCQQGGIDTRVHGFEVLGPKPTFWPVFKEQLCRRTHLFYSTKAHTWCQEVAEDKAQLLQLFNKLNSALRHEQMFADRFLPDAEAAEALGRTCWEALISPIVHSITLSESSACSPLSWLLSEYLDNAESARRCKSRAAIFNSRVRRLTHLLVHVDTSAADGEELKPPVKSNGKEGKNKETPAASSSSSSSSPEPKVKGSSSIAGIALCWQGVVQWQVKKFLESSCSLPDFVERYRTLYQRLKNAMEELFGQQTAFVLAQRHGFSAALLQLSILRAMHVSERFAQYIDQMIQASGTPSGRVETLERLQQFLEPMLFLSGLELANTFEHFYRYYLGDRLLAQGNVWLESAVIDQIGSCFPSRFPQQMIKNLTELADLQQEFHLYRLQQLDQQLQEQDQMMEDWGESEEEAEVQVLVLSPRCWAVSSVCFLDEPVNHFPAELCSYLNHFTQFYTHSQSMYSLSHSKPRRLQWTWLGHAELQFGNWTLHVSTLQMFILLQFNSEEEVRVEALLQESGLSAAVLLHALQPLISERGPLTCNPVDEPGRGVLQLKQQVASRSLQGIPASLHLLPMQTYLNVDEDATGTLERKRNFIYCLIVNIMKQEKEMHIDNLVFKVMDSCQKQEASRSPCAGRFGCSTGDVLSCIMHVINKGCVRRNDDNPHIVEFVPEDPSTPQKGHAQFSFSRSDSRKDAAATDSMADISLVPAPRRFEDGVLDSGLFSMGRTMTQEEVRQLMQRTVQQVSATLSLDLDRAEHLLIHCKWNVDLLVQRYTDDPDALIMAAGLRCRNPQPPPSPASTCPVCLGPRTGSMEPIPTLSCMHYCCRSCWQEYLTARIEQNLVMNCNCPITDCQAQPTSQFFLGILTDKDTVAKYENALLRGYVECCSNLTWCTNPQGCDQILCKENIGSMGTCSKCCWSSCFSCNFPEAHYPASCSHMSQWMDDGGFYEGMSMEAQSKHLAKLISKRCPSCQAQIEKNEGCLHMTCAKCNHGFCWRCLKPWKPTHKDYYNCSAMVSKAARQEKKFQDYNERCTFHHQAKDFAVNLENKVSSINEALQMKSLTFVIDACKILAQARKVLAYSCVYSYYNQETEKMDVMEQQTEALDLHTNALQILLEETLLQCTDLASCVRLLKPEHLNTGLELIRRIQDRLLAILQHSTQDFRVGYQSKSSQEPESTQASSLSNHTDTNNVSKTNRGSDSGDSDNNTFNGEEGGEEAEDDEYDEEYVPEWHEDYDEDDIDEDDFFSDDDESENLERDFIAFD